MDGLGTVHGLTTNDGLEAVRGVETVRGLVSVEHLSNACMEKQTQAIVTLSLQQGAHTHCKVC